VALLALFIAWELRAAEPMIDLELFRRPRFLWGTVAGTLASFGLYGLLFVLPQYLQAVRGHDALNTGVRLLPLMAGLAVGARLGALLTEKIGARVPVAAGLALIGAGLGLGAATAVGTGYGYTALWLSVVGVGTGFALAPAMDAVMGELPAERAGSGTALTMTLRQVGGALGVALLGSVSAATYTDRLSTADLPAPLADAVRDSVSGGVAVAAQLRDTALLAGVQGAYVHAMDVVLVVCAAVALLGAVLAAAFLPARPTAVPAPGGGPTDPAPGPEPATPELTPAGR
jgi:hypothetical protein